MIVAKVKCKACGKIVELDDKYGWTKDDEKATWKIIICDECDKREEDGEIFVD